MGRLATFPKRLGGHPRLSYQSTSEVSRHFPPHDFSASRDGACARPPGGETHATQRRIAKIPHCLSIPILSTDSYQRIHNRF